MENNWIKVEGDSMRPFLNSNDLVCVEWDHTHPPALGELILGKSGELWIVHRMIGIKNNKFMIKGDSSFTIEEMTQNDLWGKVIAWKKAGTQTPITHKKTILDLMIAVLGRYEFRRAAKLLGLIKRQLSFIL